MSAATASPLLVRGADADPVVLTGPPTRLRGDVHLTNTGSAPLRVRGFGVRGEGLTGGAGGGRLTARIAGGDAVATRAALALPAATPPGRYAVTLDLGGHEVAATLVVAADPSSDVTPGRVLCGPGRTEVELLVANTGNVPLDLAPRTRARLRADPDLAAPPLLPGPGDGDGDDGGPHAALEVRDPAPLAPGERRAVRAAVVVPDDVEPERRYLALLPVATATLRVVVTPAPPAAGTYTGAFDTATPDPRSHDA